MNSYYVEIPMTPVAKARARTSNGHAYTPEKTKAAEEMIKIYLQANHAPLFKGAVSVHLIFDFIRPKSVSQKREYPTVVPDLDNLTKLVLDAANKILWDDDSQIVQIYAGKRYALKASITIMVKQMVSIRRSDGEL